LFNNFFIHLLFLFLEIYPFLMVSKKFQNRITLGFSKPLKVVAEAHE